jgi:hypothetical protein
MRAFVALLMLLMTGCAALPQPVTSNTGTTPALVAPPATRVLGQADVYVAADGARLEVVLDQRTDIAIVKQPDGGMAIIPAELAGSTERFRNEQMMLWLKDGSALLWRSGQLLFTGRIEAERQ